MLNTLYYSVFLILLLFMLTLILYVVSYKSITDREKMSPFERGFDSLESSCIQFSSYFFMIAVIFMIFDIEMLIIMPLIVLMTNMKISSVYMIMYSCLLMLFVGLFDEWNNKLLDWL